MSRIIVCGLAVLVCTLDAQQAEMPSALPPPTDTSLSAGTHISAGLSRDKSDSTRGGDTRDSLMRLRDTYHGLFRTFPLHHDSLRSPWRLLSFQVHGADANGISEALRFAPLFVTIPYSLSGSFNRALFMGFPTPRRYLEEPWYLFPAGPSAVRGTDWLFAGNVLQVISIPQFSLRLDPRPLPTVSPITFLTWENGVFDENTLHVLFGRPLTQRLTVGVSSDYRSFRGTSFSHSPGNVYGSYRQLVSDTSLIVNRGYAPRVDEHVVSFRTTYTGAVRIQTCYSYLDIHNERAFGRDSVKVWWATAHQYGQRAAISLDSLQLGSVRTHGALLYTQDIERETRPLDERGYYRLTRRGEQNAVSAGVAGEAALWGNDTLTMELRGWVGWKDFFHERNWVLSHTRLTLHYGRMLGDSTRGLAASGGVGHVVETVNDKEGNTWTWYFRACGYLSNQQVCFFARRDVLPYDPPFAPELTFPGRIPDAAECYGVEMYLHSRLSALYTAYLYSIGVDSASLLHAWPEASPPYAEPRHTLVIAPSVGRLAGFSLYARYMLCDARPYHKLQSGLAWEWQASDKNHVIRFELAADWWSEREPVFFGGTNTWNRPIVDLYGKGTVEIKSFRFFYKVDNILNRKFAYVPGYFMPGLTFRWGFNWFFGR